MKKCCSCQEEFSFENFYKRSKNKHYSMCKSCFNKYCIERWIKRKIFAIKEKGNKCFDCKKSYHYSVYDFHHLDPSKKDLDWSKMRLVSDEKLKKELDKCVLLCSNCHRLRHHKQSV